MKEPWKEPWKEGTFIRMRPVLGIEGSVWVVGNGFYILLKDDGRSVWVVDIVGNGFYILLKDDGRGRRKVLNFANQENWEEVTND